MDRWSRRDLLKSSIAVPVAAAAVPDGMLLAQTSAAGQAVAAGSVGGTRERLLLDFGWRFHFGNADDRARDFGFGTGRAGVFQKIGGLLSPSNLTFDDGDWTAVDLPHDWAVRLPFKNDPALSSKGSYPLGRDYPETSVGWYRRMFDLPPSNAGRRISIEFDGAYRDAMVISAASIVSRGDCYQDLWVADRIERVII